MSIFFLLFSLISVGSCFVHLPAQRFDTLSPQATYGSLYAMGTLDIFQASGEYQGGSLLIVNTTLHPGNLPGTFDVIQHSLVADANGRLTRDDVTGTLTFPSGQSDGQFVGKSTQNGPLTGTVSSDGRSMVLQSSTFTAAKKDDFVFVSLYNNNNADQTQFTQSLVERLVPIDKYTYLGAMVGRVGAARDTSLAELARHLAQKNKAMTNVGAGSPFGSGTESTRTGGMFAGPPTTAPGGSSGGKNSGSKNYLFPYQVAGMPQASGSAAQQISWSVQGSQVTVNVEQTMMNAKQGSVSVSNKGTGTIDKNGIIRLTSSNSTSVMYPFNGGYTSVGSAYLNGAPIATLTSITPSQLSFISIVDVGKDKPIVSYGQGPFVSPGVYQSYVNQQQ